MEPRSSLFLPPSLLSSCLFGAIYRDTRGAVMSDTDRVNHFPASPLVSVTLVACGELRLLDMHCPNPLKMCQSSPPLPKLFVVGPTAHPISSWAPGPVLALTIGIYHDAWLQLGGDQGYSTAPESLVRALEHFAAQDVPEAGWDAFCGSLGPIWAGQRTHAWKGIQGIADWKQSIIARVALSGSGQSLRSFERRLKRFSGHTQQALNFYSSVENLHMISQQNAGATLADVAIEAGYSDQSHMGRAVRRATGFSPAQLNHAIKTEEAFWCYRLLGERF